RLKQQKTRNFMQNLAFRYTPYNLPIRSSDIDDGFAGNPVSQNISRNRSEEQIRSRAARQAVLKPWRAEDIAGVQLHTAVQTAAVEDVRHALTVILVRT